MKMINIEKKTRTRIFMKGRIKDTACRRYERESFAIERKSRAIVVYKEDFTPGECVLLQQPHSLEIAYGIIHKVGEIFRADLKGSQKVMDVQLFYCGYQKEILQKHSITPLPQELLWTNHFKTLPASSVLKKITVLECSGYDPAWMFPNSSVFLCWRGLDVQKGLAVSGKQGKSFMMNPPSEFCGFMQKFLPHLSNDQVCQEEMDISELWVEDIEKGYDIAAGLLLSMSENQVVSQKPML